MRHLIVLLLLLPAQVPAADQLRVLTSIGPLQLIASEIMQRRGTVDVLIDEDASPHHFQLKPSHLRKVAKTDLLIWVSNDFETSLGRLEDKLPPGSQRLQLVHHLPQEQLIGSGHDLDGHIWLSAKNVRIIGQLIAERLSSLDAANAANYRDNAARLSRGLDTWHGQAVEGFTQQKPAYITNHSFLAYFEQDLDLQAIGSLRNSHDHGGRLRSLSQLHARLRQQPAKCLLLDRLPASRQAQQLAARYDLPVKRVHILSGSDQLDSIIDMYRHITQILRQCH